MKRQRNIVPSNYNTRGARGNAIATPHLYRLDVPRFPDVPVDPRKRVPRHRGRRMDRYEGFPARGTGRSTPNAHAVAPSGPKCPSRSRIYDGGSLRRFLHTQTGEAHVDAYLTWTLSSGGAVPAAVSCLDDFFQHSDYLT